MDKIALLVPLVLLLTLIFTEISNNRNKSNKSKILAEARVRWTIESEIKNDNVRLTCMDVEDLTITFPKNVKYIAMYGCRFVDCRFISEGNPILFTYSNCTIRNCVTKNIKFINKSDKNLFKEIQI